jgi:hypothetical protein
LRDEKDEFSFVSQASTMPGQLNSGGAYQNFMLGFMLGH